MRLGLHLRNMGTAATPDLIRDCARIADDLPIDELWVFDHLAIPPAQSEGSGGRYFDAMATLAFVAAVTERIAIGTRILVLPFRPPLVTAKLVASVQELSGGRFQLGVGIGAIEEEFGALGVDKSRRGALADEALELLHRCFNSDEVTINGETVLFLPRPERPPIFVGGKGGHAYRRAARFAQGWMASGPAEPDILQAPIIELRRHFEEAGKHLPEVSVSDLSTLEEPARLSDRIAALEEIGVTRIAFRFAYDSAAEFGRHAEHIARLSAG